MNIIALIKELVTELLDAEEFLCQIFFTSRYLRDAPPAKPENYVRYIRTREGVEKAEGADRNFLRQSGRKIGSTRSSVIFWQQMKCWNIRIFYFSPLGKTLRSLSLAPLSRTLT